MTDAVALRLPEAIYYAMRESLNAEIDQRHIDRGHDALIRWAIALVEAEFPENLLRCEVLALAQAARRRLVS